ncbi:MAG: hypothetical protein GQ570_01715 [Helicobacteraceae bacterium]|nr:hypothetical protein [Helicobacteraceae bacterium]
MINIEELKPLIIEKLMPLKPDKIILFGSYAYGTPNEDSDIDLFLLKDKLKLDDLVDFEIEAHLKMQDLISKYHIGFDILSDSTSNIKKREDYFHKVEILQNSEVLYE